MFTPFPTANDVVFILTTERLLIGTRLALAFMKGMIHKTSSAKRTFRSDIVGLRLGGKQLLCCPLRLSSVYVTTTAHA
jgi:hypothetical protein